MHYNCLIADDEEILADSTAEYFNLFDVKTAAVYSSEECLDFLNTNTADLLLLDINLDESSEFSLCKELREKTDIPILFISATNCDDDKIAALSIEGDDCIQKPYSLGVLLAKVKAVLRHYEKEQKSSYDDGYLRIDFAAREVFVEDSPVKLTAMEFKLLACLIEGKGRMVSKPELFEKVWENRFAGNYTLNVHIRGIRAAIERDSANHKYILNVWGNGFRFVGRNQ